MPDNTNLTFSEFEKQYNDKVVQLYIDHELSPEQLKAFAEEGIPAAQYHLGHAYFCGTHGKRDFIKAIEWWEKAARPRSEDAYNSLKFIKGIKNLYKLYFEHRFSSELAEQHKKDLEDEAYIKHFTKAKIRELEGFCRKEKHRSERLKAKMEKLAKRLEIKSDKDKAKELRKDEISQKPKCDD